jgi:hypothetical protein
MGTRESLNLILKKKSRFLHVSGVSPEAVLYFVLKVFATKNEN